MTKDEALRLALKFIEANHSGGPDAFELIDIIKSALEAKDEPVAWEQFYPDIGKNQFAYLPPSPFSISGKPQSSQQEENEFNPDWDTQAVLVEEIQRMAKRIEELEAKDEPVAWPAGLIERIKAAEQRVQDGHAPRRIPADPSDVDLVLAEVRYLLDGKQPPFWVNTTPPQRTWVGLTDEEVADIERNSITRRQAIRAIEAKLKEKNT